MARFEVFIPAAEPEGMSLTLRVTADTWMAALKVGLKKIGHAGGMPQNVLCDVQDDESIHVTDPRSNRVFRIVEIPEVSEPGKVAAGGWMAPPSGPPEQFAAAAAQRVVAEQAEQLAQVRQAAHAEAEALAAQARAAAEARGAVERAALEKLLAEKSAEAKAAAERAAAAEARATAAQQAAAGRDRSLTRAAEEAAAAEARRVAESRAADEARLSAVRAAAERAIAAKAAQEKAAQEKIAHERVAAARAAGEKAAQERAAAEQAERKRAAESSAATARADQATREQAQRSAPPPPAEAAQGPRQEPRRPVPASGVKVVEAKFQHNRPPPQIGRGEAARDGAPENAALEDVLVELFERAPAVFDRPAAEALYYLLDLALEKIPADSGSVYVADLNRRDLRFAAARGPKSRELLELDLRVPMGRGFVGFCAQEGVAVAISDAQRDRRFFKDISERLGYETRSVLTTPISANGRTLGALQLINKKGSSSFTPAELSVLQYVAHQAARYLEAQDV